MLQIKKRLVLQGLYFAELRITSGASSKDPNNVWFIPVDEETAVKKIPLDLEI
jgi:hypothetical protein